MNELLSNELFRLTVDDGIARVTRSATPPPPAAEMAASYTALSAAMRRSGARRVLLDLRGGPPGRNDPEFERAGEDRPRGRPRAGDLHGRRRGDRFSEAAMSDIYSDDYYHVRIDHGVLRLERTPTPYPSMEAMHAANRLLAVAVRGAGVRRILLDLRKGPPGRNDEAFEHHSAVWRKQLSAEVDRAAILVRTVAGKLQSQRLARDEGRTGKSNVFMDEAEALAFLAQ